MADFSGKKLALFIFIKLEHRAVSINRRFYTFRQISDKHIASSASIERTKNNFILHYMQAGKQYETPHCIPGNLESHAQTG